jgi:hypothetical protein
LSSRRNDIELLRVNIRAGLLGFGDSHVFQEIGLKEDFVQILVQVTDLGKVLVIYVTSLRRVYTDVRTFSLELLKRIL